MLFEAESTLVKFVDCDETTGLRNVTGELQFTVESFAQRLDRTANVLDLSRRCYETLEQVTTSLIHLCPVYVQQHSLEPSNKQRKVSK